MDQKHEHSMHLTCSARYFGTQEEKITLKHAIIGNMIQRCKTMGFKVN